MKYYTSTTEFNCGIDLHAHQMYICLVDRQGNKLLHTNIRNNDFAFFLKLIAPYRHDLTVVCEPDMRGTESLGISFPWRRLLDKFMR